MCAPHMRTWCSKRYNIRWARPEQSIYLKFQKLYLSSFLCVRCAHQLCFYLCSLLLAAFFVFFFIMPNRYCICAPVCVCLWILLFETYSFKFKYSEISLTSGLHFHYMHIEYWLPFFDFTLAIRFLFPTQISYCQAIHSA